ncbi:hypothetical protein Nepgr_017456 [Nepenthes gracilis]|uniref:Uncharacterized protein n=1 Tax=Nepenthes gracilis TaxID=150966 RepID=A0AAD3XTD6_NEPGR|nr:hypothetical protein Nepgr_017456 [Nepenthes gracilis]
MHPKVTNSRKQIGSCITPTAPTSSKNCNNCTVQEIWSWKISRRLLHQEWHPAGSGPKCKPTSNHGLHPKNCTSTIMKCKIHECPKYELLSRQQP